MTTGIYLIVQRSSGRSYVGKSKDVDARLEQHFAVKKLDSHRARTLRGIDEAIWRSRDESDFVTKIVTVCCVAELDSYEAAWIDALGVANALVGFNAAIRHVDSTKALTSSEVDDAKDFIAAVTLNLPILNTDALVAELRSYRMKFEKLADMLAESQSRCRELEAEIASCHVRQQRKRSVCDVEVDDVSDSVALWLVDEALDPAQEFAYCRPRDVYDRYEEWCNAAKETKCAPTEFKSRVCALGKFDVKSHRITERVNPELFVTLKLDPSDARRGQVVRVFVPKKKSETR